MFKIFLSLSLFLLTFSAFAQSTEDQVQTAVAEQVNMYQLDEAQQEEMQVIQERRFRNLDEIEGLRHSNYSLYLKKLRNIRLGTEKSTRRILTDAQVRIFEQMQADRRVMESEKINELRKRGATKGEIERAVLEMEL